MTRRSPLLWFLLAACSHDAPVRPDPSRPGIATQGPQQHGVSSSTSAASPEPPPDPAAETSPPSRVGCWEREFGAAPKPEGLRPAVDAPIEGCPGCEDLLLGPDAGGLHVEVLRRLAAIDDSLPAPELAEPVVWVNSGAREGPPGKSMHNQALAVDIVICGHDTRTAAQALRDAGFTCVIEYYDPEGNPCHMAHGDLRGTEWARGAYASGGWKSRTCPGRAVSRGEDCQNSAKEDWQYRTGSR